MAFFFRYSVKIKMYSKSYNTIEKKTHFNSKTKVFNYNPK